MSDIHEKLDKVDVRLQKIERWAFNGATDTLKELKLLRPNLMTKADHAALEAVRLEQMRLIGKKKDRTVRLIGIFLGFLGSGTILGVITLIVRGT